MQMFEIRPSSLPLLTVLNNGVTPQMETQKMTFFVYHEDRPAEIIDVGEAMRRAHEHHLSLAIAPYYS